MLEVHDVTYGYDGTPVVSGLSLSIGSGETVGVVGANGAGKTTLLKLVAGLFDPDAGSVEVEGTVGFAHENAETALFAETVGEEVAFFPRNRGLRAEPRVERALRRMGIAHLRDRQPLSLSVGEQRRVAIAAVLAGEPAVVALDEPTAGLGRPDERRLGEHLSALDATVLFSTHEADFAYEFADRIAVMVGGEVVRTGPPGVLFTDEELLEEAGVRVPGLVDWARRRGDDEPPKDFESALEAAREG